MAIRQRISISFWMSRTFMLSVFKAIDGLGMNNSPEIYNFDY